MSLQGQLDMEIELIEEDYTNGVITLEERNRLIRELEKEAWEYEEEQNY